ncbi:MAG TPA: helix-turn-helix transcriptional regulator [Nitrospiria bacterium]
MRLKTFGEWLRHQRLKKGISPFRMAEELGYKRVSAIYNFEYGIAPLPISKWPALAQILRMPIQEFLGTMERYYPGKAAEFRMIQSTAGGSREPGRVSISRPSVGVSVVPEEGVSDEGEIRTFHAADAEWVLATRDPWDDSLIVSVDRLRRGKKLGVGLLQVNSSDSFPGPGVVSWLKETRGVLGIEDGGKKGSSGSISDRIKGVFMDALTGAKGYPEMHRVPRVFTVSGASELAEWTPEIIMELVKKIKEKGDNRRLVLSPQKAPAEVLKTVDKLPGGGL